MLQQFKELEKLAKDWREFSRETYGWNSRTYEDNTCHVWCYFSDDGSHTSVEINSCQIAFFSPVRFGGLNYQNLKDFENLIKNGRALLDSEKRQAKQRTEDEKMALKASRIEALKAELEALQQ